MIGRQLITLIRDESGPTAVEYAVMLALVIVGLVQVIGGLAHVMLQQYWLPNTSTLSGAMGGS
jgi:Flp pilus assembly pilin Flp